MEAKKIIKPLHQPRTNTNGQLFNFPLRRKYIFLALTAFIFYANTLFNKFALDDTGVILKNTYVKMGFGGIPKILTHDFYASYYAFLGGDSQLSGGRYRPLSEIIFAIEYQLFGNSTLLPYFCHLVNVLAFITCSIALFYFLNKFLLKKSPHGNDIAFLSSFLFAIHPIHTEVVANIKSLDEILSLLFILLTFIFSIRYLESKKNKQLSMAAGSFLLALLSKEYAITLLFFIPFLFYLLANKKPSTAVIAGMPYYGVFVLYLLLRFNAVGFHGNIHSTNLLANPYLYATDAQKIATEWVVLGKYPGLLFFPYPLSADYSYNQIPYHSFADISVIISILIYVSIFACGVILMLRKSVLAFAVFFLLFNIFLVSNFILDIGATMGERFLFHPSVGFVIILSWYLIDIFSTVKLQIRRRVAFVILSLAGLACFGETVIRNAQWKDDNSLFIHDVKVSPNSFLANNYAGAAYMRLSGEKENTNPPEQLLDSAKKYLVRSLHVAPEDEVAIFDLGIVYGRQGLLDSARYYWNVIEKLNPHYPGLDTNFVVLSRAYLNKGIDLGNNGSLDEGIKYMKKALTLDAGNTGIWYNIGVAYFRNQQYDSARNAFVRIMQLSPGNENARQGLQALQQIGK